MKHRYDLAWGLPLLVHIEPSPEDSSVGVICGAEVHPYSSLVYQMKPAVDVSKFKNHATLVEALDKIRRDAFHKTREIFLDREIQEYFRNPGSVVSSPVKNH
ncbi:MAG TPA: hypothetical protein VKE88_03660 [Candidatus Nanoarchaeia archaeon]|nr:hypothetical protein [Candidatus Nanoarchaeia archaeon]